MACRLQSAPKQCLFVAGVVTTHSRCCCRLNSAEERKRARRERESGRGDAKGGAGAGAGVGEGSEQLMSEEEKRFMQEYDVAMDEQVGAHRDKQSVLLRIALMSGAVRLCRTICWMRSARAWLNSWRWAWT